MQNWLSNFQPFSFQSSNFQMLSIRYSVRPQLSIAVKWAKTMSFWFFFFWVIKKKIHFFSHFLSRRTFSHFLILYLFGSQCRGARPHHRR